MNINPIHSEQDYQKSLQRIEYLMKQVTGEISETQDEQQFPLLFFFDENQSSTKMMFVQNIKGSILS
jgi:hypothetical protein